MQVHLLAYLELQRLVLHLQVRDGGLQALESDRVLLQLLVVIGLDLFDEMDVHVLDVSQVGAYAWVHGRHYLLESVRNNDQELLLVDLVVRIFGLLALVLFDEGGVDALGLAEALMHEL